MPQRLTHDDNADSSHAACCVLRLYVCRFTAARVGFVRMLHRHNAHAKEGRMGNIVHVGIGNHES